MGWRPTTAQVSRQKQGAKRQPAPTRQELIDELVGGIGSWSPAERIRAFRAWTRGALSVIHLHVLTVVEVEGPLPMSRLADALDVSVASTTGIVTRMEQRGLVERRHSTDDRRIVLVHATEAGASVFRELEERRRTAMTNVLAMLSDEELHGFVIGSRAMQRARAELSATDQGAEMVAAARTKLA